MPLPEALERAEFEQRKPAMGLTKALLLELREHVQNKGLTPKEHRFLFKRIRSEMLRQLIPCSDISTTLDLISILENEIDIGVPSPVPKWYKVRIGNHYVFDSIDSFTIDRCYYFFHTIIVLHGHNGPSENWLCIVRRTMLLQNRRHRNKISNLWKLQDSSILLKRMCVFQSDSL